MSNIDELLNRKYTLQTDILRSWNELHAMKLNHQSLLEQLSNLNEQIRLDSEPSLFDQLFSN